MRIEVSCKDRLGITQEVLSIVVQHRVNLTGIELGHRRLFLKLPGAATHTLNAIIKDLVKISGVNHACLVPFMPSEREHYEFNIVMDAMPEPIFSVDKKGVVLVANQATKNFFKQAAESYQNTEIIGKNLNTFCHNLEIENLTKDSNNQFGLHVSCFGENFIADSFPVCLGNDENNRISGAVIYLHSMNRIGKQLAAFQNHNQSRALDQILHQCERMKSVVAEAQRVASLQATLLVVGDTGTGKELFARACHEESERRDKPFLALNCAALPENAAETELFGSALGNHEASDFHGKPGLIELAEGGTIFLDEVGDMSPYLQVKLLRFLQDGRFRRVGSQDEIRIDVRVICATHHDLPALVEQKRFRGDLFYRLKVLTLNLPTLKERGPEEIQFLAEHFAKESSQQIQRPCPKFSKPALDLMQNYHWPGNVRQLENAIFQAVTIVETAIIEPMHLRLPYHLTQEESAPLQDPYFEREMRLDEAMKHYEKHLLESLYPKYPSTRKLGKRLGISHTAVANKLKEYGLMSTVKNS
ncbi:MAG: sigma 54-interacting transcriptional regulator [Pseudomonadota bacterium]